MISTTIMAVRCSWQITNPGEVMGNKAVCGRLSWSGPRRMLLIKQDMDFRHRPLGGMMVDLIAPVGHRVEEAGGTSSVNHFSPSIDSSTNSTWTYLLTSRFGGAETY